MRTLRRCLRCPHAVADTELFCPKCEESINNDLASANNYCDPEPEPRPWWGLPLGILIAAAVGAVSSALLVKLVHWILS